MRNVFVIDTKQKPSVRRDAAKLQRLCDRVAKKAEGRGLTQKKLGSLLGDDGQRHKR
jgi:hypothetical protein